jgi:hypothetical protein
LISRIVYSVIILLFSRPIHPHPSDLGSDGILGTETSAAAGEKLIYDGGMVYECLGR